MISYERMEVDLKSSGTEIHKVKEIVCNFIFLYQPIYLIILPFKTLVRLKLLFESHLSMIVQLLLLKNKNGTYSHLDSFFKI